MAVLDAVSSEGLEIPVIQLRLVPLPFFYIVIMIWYKISIQEHRWAEDRQFANKCVSK